MSSRSGEFIRTSGLDYPSERWNRSARRVSIKVMSRVAAVGLLVALVSLSVPAGATPARVSVALVPMGSFGAPSLQALAGHFQRELHVRGRVLPGVPLNAGAYNVLRKQYAAEQLLAQLERLHPSGVVIGVTTQDMWMATKSYRFVFSIRDARAAVVSTARMDPKFFAAIPDSELFYSRIEKITTKDIAILALGRRESSNPRSVLYNSILSLDDVDFMTETFAPRPYRAGKRAWLAHVNTACTTASAQEAALRTTPIRTSDDLLGVLGKAIEIEKRVLATINSIRPARGDAALVNKLRSTFARSVATGEATLAALTARWDAARFKQWAAQNSAIGADLAANSLRLGSKSCAAYFR